MHNDISAFAGDPLRPDVSDTFRLSSYFASVIGIRTELWMIYQDPEAPYIAL